MEISLMTNTIIKIIDTYYNEYLENESMDIIQIKNICGLYDTDNAENTNNILSNDTKIHKKISGNEFFIFEHNNVMLDNNSSFTDIFFSSPELEIKQHTVKYKNQNNRNIIYTDEFKKKFSLFIKIIYTCLKMGVELFDIDNDILILKNNYNLAKSLKIRKKELINSHIEKLQGYQKNIFVIFDNEYDVYVSLFITKIKLIDKVLETLRKILSVNIMDESDNLITMIIPYFFEYTKFIEEYNN